MNRFIKEQLNKCSIQLPEYDDNTTQIFIPKLSSTVVQDKELDFSVGMCYNIEVERYITEPYEGFTLHQNWNKGIIPTDRQMNCEVIQIMGKMINVNAVGVNDGKQWVGWLPKKSCKIMKEI